MTGTVGGKEKKKVPSQGTRGNGYRIFWIRLSRAHSDKREWVKIRIPVRHEGGKREKDLHSIPFERAHEDARPPPTHASQPGKTGLLVG